MIFGRRTITVHGKLEKEAKKEMGGNFGRRRRRFDGGGKEDREDSE